MKKNKLTVTIGIPAYNEEANIKNLLQSILKQEERGFYIEKIIVISDGSTDKTVQEIKKVKNKRIYMIENKKRQGQTKSQNKIFIQAKSDVVVLLEADTFPLNNNYLSNLILPLRKNSEIGLVQGNFTPISGKTMLEKSLSAQISLFKEFNMNHANTIYILSSGRGGRAFSKNVYKKLVFPKSVPEDVYALLWCRNKNIEVTFQKSAVCLYRCPQTISDYVKERFKIQREQVTIKHYFSQELIDKVYQRSFSYKIKSFIYFSTMHPFEFIYYLYLTIITKISLFSKKMFREEFTDFWSTTSSTKSLSL